MARDVIESNFKSTGFLTPRYQSW